MITDLRSAYGDDNQRVLLARFNQVSIAGDAVGEDEQLRLLLPLVADLDRAVGSDNWLTLTARLTLATINAHRAENKRTDELRNLIPRLEKVFGPDDERTITARGYFE